LRKLRVVILGIILAVICFVSLGSTIKDVGALVSAKISSADKNLVLLEGETRPLNFHISLGSAIITSRFSSREDKAVKWDIDLANRIESVDKDIVFVMKGDQKDIILPHKLLVRRSHAFDSLNEWNGMISIIKGEMELRAPAEYFSNLIAGGDIDVALAITTREDKIKTIGPIYSLRAESYSYNGREGFAVLSIGYEGTQVSDYLNLAIYGYNPSTMKWEQVPSVVDAINKRVVAQIDQLTDYAVFEAQDKPRVQLSLGAFIFTILLSLAIGASISHLHSIRNLRI
jgi:hypothetical protein